MLYALQMTISYEFNRPTGTGRQLLRVMPADIAGRQSLLSAEVTITPRPLERHEFTDYFGTDVISVVMPPGLTDLRFEMTARVARHADDQALDMSPTLAILPVDLAAVYDIGAASPHHFLGPSPRIAPDPAIATFARAATAKAATTLKAIEALGLALNALMTFDAKATEVYTLPSQAFALKRGVCQDFAQIMISGLRDLGIPAAYVAGFLRTIPPKGKLRLAGADAMHAWVRAWAGAEAGWVEYDPTNRCFVSTDHIVVGYGRDYGDVAPVTGALRLDGGQKTKHAVDLTEIALR